MNQDTLIVSGIESSVVVTTEILHTRVTVRFERTGKNAGPICQFNWFPPVPTIPGLGKWENLTADNLTSLMKETWRHGVPYDQSCTLIERVATFVWGWGEAHAFQWAESLL